MGKNGKKILILLSVVLSLLFLSLVGLSIYEYVRIKPNNVHFTNVTSNSVTVSWNTEKEVVGTVKVYEGDSMLPISVLGMNKRFFDTRDVKEAELLAVEKTSENIMANEELTLSVDNFDTEVVVDNMGEYYTHHVTVVGLDPEVEYSFMVGDEYLFRKVKDNNESVLVKTLPVVEEIKSPLPAYGSVKDAENETELPVDELAIISDGIVYFNYYEETTEARSSVFSSTLSDSGAWYVDVATATDQSGKPFFDTYSSVEHEFKIELTLDAGPFGVWKIREINGSNSPTPPIIINFPSPLEDEDIEGSVIKISSVLDPFVQGVSARDIIKNPPKEQEPVQPHCDEGNVLFIGYCGGCRVKCDDGLYRDRSCPQKTLCARGCIDCDDSKTPPAENPIKCGGHDLGTVTKYGSSCLICSKRPSNGYYIGAWEDGNDRYDPNNNCNPKCKPQSCAVLSESLYPFSACPGASNTCSSQIYKDCGGEITCYKRIIPTAPESEEGGPTKDENASCIPKSCTALSEDSDDKYYFGECKTANDSFICTSHRFPDDGCDNPKTCFSIKNRPSDAIESEDTPPLIELRYSEEACWKGTFRGSYRILPDGTLQRCTKSGDWKNEPTSTGSQRCQDLYDLGEGAYCNLKKDFCSISNESGVYTDYICDGKKWVKWGDYKAKNPETEIPAGNVQILPTGQQCSAGRCLCPENLIVGPGGFCPEVEASSCNFGNVGSICNQHGFVCRIVNSEAHNVDTENEAKRYYLDGEEGTVCVKDSNKCYKGIDTRNNLQPFTQVAAVFCLQNNDSSLKLDRENPLISLLNQRGIGEVLAENNKEDTVGYIIDPQTGMISDIDPGSYLIEYNNEHYAFEIRDYELENNEGSVLIYIDKDDNGEYNSETDLKISDIASEISVIALNAEHKYSLTEGFNFVSFPFLVSGAEYRTAAGLLKKLNEVYNNSLYSISKFDGGQWKIVGENVQLYDNNDFQLLPAV
ncbi:fibronectin type III domain-containing protein, partial [Candidatus Dojkabacteria bacterium]|nr:fibronectin type III domain-containing protein [Candidatus Dojkabacteria bacterium]